MTLTNRKPRVLVLEGLRNAASCVRAAGGTPIVMSPLDIEAVDEALAQPFDALLLTGGGDVDPRLYGQKPHPKTYGVNEVRDYTEWSALDVAKEKGVPVMGICRGAQLIAIHNGGKLKQHIHGHRGRDHLVFAERNSVTFKIALGDHPRGMFVSLHHQVIVRTGDGFRVAGRAPDGGIEAIESRDGRVLAVQFHPEYDYDGNVQSQRLFAWLTVEAARRAKLVTPKEQRRAPKRKRTEFERALSVQNDPMRRKPKRSKRGTAPMITRWFCKSCGMEFDRLRDRDDHEAFIHGDAQMVIDDLPMVDLPEDHPEWVPGSNPGEVWH